MSDDSRFFSFLKDRIGLDVTSVGEGIIVRALQQRLQGSNSADQDAYWQLLQSSPDEQQALIEAVIVPETWFFRYPESFLTLSKLAAERLATLNGARPLRILSLPCSTGEEPYSIAMALFDANISAQHFKVDAIDISPLSIQKACRGIYGKNSFRGDDISYRDRFFKPVEDGYQVEERVRSRVNFQSGNLLDPRLATQEAYDFVFCRNLVIYFDQPTQRHVFKVLKRLTREDGLLFIGPAEGNLLARVGMRSAGIPQSFAFRHTPAQDAIATTPPVEAVPITRSAAAPVREPVRPAPRPFTPPPASGKPFEAPRTAPAVSASDDVTTLLTSIASLANEGKSAEARAACERYLQQHEPVAQVFYWLGLLSEVEGNATQAQGFYRKALYLQPQHPESLAQLAALLAAQGDTAGARRLQDRAARGANKQGSNR